MVTSKKETVTKGKMMEKIKQTEKWCPMARLSVTGIDGENHSANRFDLRDAGALDNYGRVKCIADACGVFDAEKQRCGLIHG